MLLAFEKGAALIVSVGAHFNLLEFLERRRGGMSSTFLTRLRIGEKSSSLFPISRAPQVAAKETPAAVSIISRYIIIGKPPSPRRQRNQSPASCIPAARSVPGGRDSQGGIAVELTFDK